MIDSFDTRAWSAFVASIKPKLSCYYEDEFCSGVLEHVKPMTCYGDEPENYTMCRAHANEYRNHWREMWAVYYAGLL